MARAFSTLPINADEGFPQAFRLTFGESTFRISLYVTRIEDRPPQELDVVYELPTKEAYLVMTVTREGPEPEIIFHRRIVPDNEYEAHELAFVFRELRVHRRNLNGVGSFGSVVRGGVASRWAS
jgi:hypothetical protein